MIRLQKQAVNEWFDVINVKKCHALTNFYGKEMTDRY